MKKNAVVIFILMCFCAAGCRTGGSIVEGKPDWIQKPENAFNPAYYICGVGSGSSQEEADANAFANLISYFGQSVESNIQSVQAYKERITGNSVSLQIKDEISSETILSSSMNQLIGAKIYDRWKEPAKQKYHAVAVMEKSETIRIYTQLINDNIALIEKLTAVGSREKVTINTVSRYYYAADIADANAVFKNVLMVLGVSHQGAGGHTGYDYRLSAENIAAQIPIMIIVKGDVDNRISKAFAQVFSRRGFKTNAATSLASTDRPYTLNADFKMEDMPVSDSRYKYTRFVLTAALLGKDGAELLSFSTTNREGHATQNEARQRAIRSAEMAISEGEFAEKFDTITVGSPRH
jgi:hypothetical protein